MLKLATILLIIGGLNWGLWGLFEFDLVASIFGGSTSLLSKIVYVLIGIAAVYEVFAFRQLNRRGTLPRNVDRIDRAA